MKTVTIGIDIGGTSTKYGIVDLQGNSLAEGFVPTREHEDIHLFVAGLSDRIHQAIKAVPEPLDVKGIGVGAPNGNYYNGTIEHAPNLRWQGIVPIAQIFRQYFDLPIALTNDANAAAIGEMIYGGARDMRDFIVITLGTGLGSGIVVNGELLYGHDGFAGEIGHTRVIKNGRVCGCGRNGCLETYVSATGIKRTVFELMSNMNVESELRQISFDGLSAEMITLAAERGDKIALEAFEYTGEILGLALTDSVAYTSPKAIFLFGGLALAGDYIFKPTRYHFEKNLFKIYQKKIKILPSGLTDKSAAILGASALICKELQLKSPDYQIPTGN